MCDGAAIETGPCSENECGEISPETYEIIRWNLRHNYYYIDAKEGDNVTFNNPTNISARVLHESPTSIIQWMHHGNPLDFSDARHVVTGYGVIITNVMKSDSGIYLYTIHRHNTKTPIKIVVLTVDSKKVDKTILFGSSLVLICRSSPLPLIYMDLTMKWLLNGTGFSDIDMAAAYGADDFKIDYVYFNYSGEWECVVEQMDLGLSWVTSLYRIQVKPRPKFLQHLMQDKLTKIIFGNMGSTKVVLSVIISFVIILIIVIVCGTFLYLFLSRHRYVRSLSNRFKKQQTVKIGKVYKDLSEIDEINSDGDD